MCAKTSNKRPWLRIKINVSSFLSDFLCFHTLCKCEVKAQVSLQVGVDVMITKTLYAGAVVFNRHHPNISLTTPLT